MHIVEQLLNTAVEDNRLLMRNQELGDRLELFRDLEFVLYAKSGEKAELVASFVLDNRYGRPSVERIEHEGTALWRILITIHAPATEHVVHTLSAFMLCLANLYDLEYDGWGCVIQR